MQSCGLPLEGNETDNSELNARLDLLEEQGQRTHNLMRQILLAIKGMNEPLMTLAENVAQLEATINKEQDTALADEFARLVHAVETYPAIMKKNLEDIALVNGFAITPG